MAYNLDFAIYIQHLEEKITGTIMFTGTNSCKYFSGNLRNNFWGNYVHRKYFEKRFIDLYDYVNEFIVNKLSSALFRMPFPVSCIIHFM